MPRGVGRVGELVLISVGVIGIEACLGQYVRPQIRRFRGFQSGAYANPPSFHQPRDTTHYNQKVAQGVKKIYR